jgi:YD repeat-containing protein
VRKFQKLISIVLVVTFLLTVLQVDVFAEKKNGRGPGEAVSETQEVLPDISEDTVADNGAVDSEMEPDIIGEVVEKRERNVKHFLRDDGSFVAAIYPENVHYKDGDEWKEIDNSIVEQKDEENNDVLENKANDFKVRIAKKASANKLVSIKKDKYEISWGIENDLETKKYEAMDVSSSVYSSKGIDKGKENISVNKKSNNRNGKKFNDVSGEYRNKEDKVNLNLLSKNESIKAVETVTSSVYFQNIYSGVDLQYEILSNELKENIILKEKLEAPSFTFNFNVKNLEAELMSNNSIAFYDPKDKENEIFIMPAPFMFDSDGTESHDIEVAFSKEEKGYILTIIPDNEWLNNAERKYPVTIDPIIEGISPINDSYVSSGAPNNNYGSSNIMYVESGSRLAYLSFDMPNLESSDMVTSAILKLSREEYNKHTKVSVHKVLGPWNEQTITWNNKPAYDPVWQDFSTSTTTKKLDITGIFNEWHRYGNNYGVVLEQRSDVGSTDKFYSSNYSSSAYRPQITITYINAAGLEGYWTYHSQDAGRAGTAYINDATGNLVVTHSDVVENGNRLPINLTHVFNGSTKNENIGYGNGWRLSMNQKIVLMGDKAYYIDEDGTKIYFIRTGVAPLSCEYKDEAGYGYTIIYDSYYYYTLGYDYLYEMIDKYDNHMYFNEDGNLMAMEDANGNRIECTFTTGSKKLLSTITDGAGRTTTLNYSYGLLSGIIDPAGRETAYQYTSNRLTKIIYPDS